MADFTDTERLDALERLIYEAGSVELQQVENWLCTMRASTVYAEDDLGWVHPAPLRDILDCVVRVEADG